MSEALRQDSQSMNYKHIHCIQCRDFEESEHDS